MRKSGNRSIGWTRLLSWMGAEVGAICLLAWAFGARFEASGRADDPAVTAPATVAPADHASAYAALVRPMLTQYCLRCHSEKEKKGDLDLERFVTLDQVRKDIRPWQAVLENLENGEMPPRKSAAPPPEQRQKLIAWVRGLLQAEARANAGDPGRVVVRRLSNAEYNNTIRDLTGVDLQPARDFPVDGAAGEGFTNAGDALVTSPALLSKYLNAAKEITSHIVLLPDGFRFSPSQTRRDWNDEAIAALRAFYVPFTSDGKLPLAPFIAAVVRHRDELIAGKITLEAVAAKERLNAKYLDTLWKALNDPRPSFPLDRIRALWRQTKPEEAGAVGAEIAAWQGPLWKFVPIGSYRYGNTVRQLANNPAFGESQLVKLQLKPAPGQTDVVVYLSARDFSKPGDASPVVWNRPRFEGAGKPPLLLRDYADFGPQYEVDYRTIFADTSRYLAATVEAVNNPGLPAEEIATERDLDGAFLNRWIELLDLDPLVKDGSEPKEPGTRLPLVPLELLDTPALKVDAKPAIQGWKSRTADLPIVVSNASNQVEHIPGKVPPHKVAVHPTPGEFVAVAWTSPFAGRVRVAARITHAHPSCGNGIAWFMERRRGDQAFLLDAGAIDLGKGAEAAPRDFNVAAGDVVLLAIDARDANHVCDLTEIDFTITEVDKVAANPKGRVWDLAIDVADTIQQGNPHADRLGNKDVWRFVKGPARKPAEMAAGGLRIPAASALGLWRNAASDPQRQSDLAVLADQVQALLTKGQPADEKHPDRILCDTLLSPDAALFQGIDVTRLRSTRLALDRGQDQVPATAARPYSLDKTRFGRHPLGQPADEAALVLPANEVLEIRLPAALFRDRELVVECRLDPSSANRVVQFQMQTTAPRPDAPLDPAVPCVASPGSEASQRLLQGLDEFRLVFPQFVCYPRIIPDDEVVCLKLYHREDEPLLRLFLDAGQTRTVDRLWSELRFISQFPVTENQNLPLFIGFVTQDQPKELLAYFESQREPFKKRAEEFEADSKAAVPIQLQALVEFAARAFRRPLEDREQAQLLGLYETLRKKDMSHEEAFDTVMTRVLISPSFLFRIEQAAAGPEARPVSDWELATRLSYFLWASLPDAELRQAAADGHLQDPGVLAGQVARMLKDPRVRGLAAEFATQWLHVRDIRQNREKNEKLFPTYDDTLREALFEESVLFFQDLFQNDRPLHEILDADHTFVNETLARHYGIAGVTGPEWRRVTGVKKYGRGGILTLASVLTKQSGASRTSPVLRGNWLVEVMLGEKLPKPPPNVPRLPEEETGSDATVRELVEKHVRAAECAVCHQRIDPFGFALEHYDSIGRFRDKDLAGRPIDAKARLRDGTEFEGVDGLRGYLLTKRKAEFERHFCQKLLGYALGRTVSLSDQPLLDEMLDRLNKNGFRLSVALLTIVESKQFRFHRGLEATRDE